jgi:hypothetical protein
MQVRHRTTCTQRRLFRNASHACISSLALCPGCRAGSRRRRGAFHVSAGEWLVRLILLLAKIVIGALIPKGSLAVAATMMINSPTQVLLCGCCFLVTGDVIASVHIHLLSSRPETVSAAQQQACIDYTGLRTIAGHYWSRSPRQRAMLVYSLQTFLRHLN